MSAITPCLADPNAVLAWWIKGEQECRNEIESGVSDDRRCRIRITLRNSHQYRPSRNLHYKDGGVLKLGVQNAVQDGSRNDSEDRLQCSPDQRFFSNAGKQSSGKRENN